MNIKVKQHDIADCGPACLKSIAAYYGLNIPLSKIRQKAKTDRQGTSLLGLACAAKFYGFKAKGIKVSEQCIDTLQYPVIAHVEKTYEDYKILHFIVLYSYKDGVFKVMDPANGDIMTVSRETFIREWTNVLLLIEPTEECVSTTPYRSVKSFLWSVIKDRIALLVFAFIAASSYTIMGLFVSLYIEKVIDNVLVEKNIPLLHILSISMFVIVLLRSVIGMTYNMIIVRIGQKIDEVLVMGYYSRLFKMPQFFFDTMQTGEITSRINDAIKIRNFINNTIINLLINGLIVILSLSIIFWWSWGMALVISCIIPIFVIIFVLYDSFNKVAEREVMTRVASFESQLVETINSEMTIKTYSINEYVVQKAQKKFSKMMESVFKSAKGSIISMTVTEFFSQFIIILLICIGGNYVIESKLTVGELVSIYAIVGYFLNPIQNLISASKSFRESSVACDRMLDVIDYNIPDEKEMSVLKREDVGDIVFENVSFSYGHKKTTFENLNLYIKKGTLTVIVGESGCGKTTIVKLIQKLYPVNSGQIHIGSQILCNLTEDSVRSLIVTVPQDIKLFSGNILDNITLGDNNPDMAKIDDIITQLGLDSFIQSLPNGYNTYVGEYGVSLSGGQRQRIAIARAMYKDPEVIIMDEATSYLDTISEKIIHDYLYKLRNRGKTIIVIAHRLSIVRNADEIYVMKKAHIVEHGRFFDLLEKRGEFSILWENQNAKI